MQLVDMDQGCAVIFKRPIWAKKNPEMVEIEQ